MRDLQKLIRKFLEQNGLLTGKYVLATKKTGIHVRPIISGDEKMLQRLCQIGNHQGFTVLVTNPNQEHPNIKELVFNIEKVDRAKLQEHYPEEFTLETTNTRLSDGEFQTLYEG